MDTSSSVMKTPCYCLHPFVAWCGFNVKPMLQVLFMPFVYGYYCRTKYPTGLSNGLNLTPLSYCVYSGFKVYSIFFLKYHVKPTLTPNGSRDHTIIPINITHKQKHK